MTRCACFKADGTQCTREVSTKLGNNILYCWQHQKCSKMTVSPKKAPKIPLKVKQKAEKQSKQKAEKQALEAQKKAEKQALEAEEKEEEMEILKFSQLIEEEMEILEFSQLIYTLKRQFSNISLDQVKTLNKRIRSNGAEMYLVPEDVIGVKEDFTDPYFNLYPEELKRDFREIILKYLLKTGVDLRRGDFVWVESISDYRNDGKFIFDGQLIEDLASEPDEYGNVPSTYLVISEFPITYWQGVIEHNSIVWFDPSPYKKEILNNIDEQKKITSFTASDGQIYEIIDNRQIGEGMVNTISFAQALRNMTNPQDFESSEIYAHTKIKQNGRRLYLRANPQ